MADEFHFVFGPGGPVQVSRDEFAETWPYRTKSPAWYAARMAHNIGCLSPDRWSDKPELHRWLLELETILRNPKLVEGLMRGTLDGLAYMHSNPQQAAAIIDASLRTVKAIPCERPAKVIARRAAAANTTSQPSTPPWMRTPRASPSRSRSSA